MSFDRLAPHYTWMEAVLAGRRLQRCRATWLESLADARDILVVGVGHGHFLRRCAARFPHARFTAVDASAAMLREAEARVRREHQRQSLRSTSPESGPTTTRECGAPTPPQPAQAITRESDARGSRDGRERHDLRDSHEAPHPAASTRVNFLCATLPDWTPDAASFDAIVTHFFLDCFAPRELDEVVAVLARAARPEARWLISDFAVPPRGLARQRARAVHAVMYAFFRRVTRIRARRVTAPDPLLAAHGFALAGRRTSEWGLLQADLWVRTG